MKLLAIDKQRILSLTIVAKIFNFSTYDTYLVVYSLFKTKDATTIPQV